VTVEPKFGSKFKLNSAPKGTPESSSSSKKELRLSKTFEKVHEVGDERVAVLNGEGFTPSVVSKPQLNGPEKLLAIFTTIRFRSNSSSLLIMSLTKSTGHPVCTVKDSVKLVKLTDAQLPPPPMSTFGSTGSAFATEVATITRAAAMKSLQNLMNTIPPH
jgi:hypothetical protein